MLNMLLAYYLIYMNMEQEYKTFNLTTQFTIQHYHEI